MSPAAKQQLEELRDENPDALLADGFEEAFMGIARRFNTPLLAAYCYEKCILILMERDGMTFREATEFFDFNVQGAWVGENTPVFIQTEPIR